MATKKPKSSSGSNPSKSGMIIWLGISAIVILLDQITKITITKLFSYAENLPLTSFFNLTLVYNKGAAFGFLANQPGWQRIFFTVLGLGVLSSKNADQQQRYFLHSFFFKFYLTNKYSTLL